MESMSTQFKSISVPSKIIILELHPKFKIKSCSFEQNLLLINAKRVRKNGFCEDLTVGRKRARKSAQ